MRASGVELRIAIAIEVGRPQRVRWQLRIGAITEATRAIEVQHLRLLEAAAHIDAAQTAAAPREVGKPVPAGGLAGERLRLARCQQGEVEELQITQFPRARHEVHPLQLGNDLGESD